MESRWLQVLRTPVGATAFTALMVLAGLAILAPLLLHGPATHVDVAAMSEGPSAQHWLGTDALGRDMLARILVATRSSLVEALAVTFIGAVGGIMLGGASVVAGRTVSRLLYGFIQTAVAFPGVLLAMFLAVIFGLGAKGAVLALGIALMPLFARLTQTLAAGVAGRDYIAAARGLGIGRTRLLLRHVLPNVAEPLVINVTIAIGGALLAFSALSFLGLGTQPPAYDWGRLLNENLSAIYVNPAAALGAGAAVVLAGATFNLVGDAAARVLGFRPLMRPLGLPERRREDASAVTPEPRHGAVGEEPVLRVEDLTVRFPSAEGWTYPVRGVSFEVAAGESVGVVGESGSGKTLTSLAIAELLPHPGVAEASLVRFCGSDLSDLGDDEKKALLGGSLAVVFQDPAATFNPLMRVGRQLAEVPEIHAGASRDSALSLAVDRLRLVDIPEPERRARQYPHEYSGGMLQRATMAMSLMASPRLIIADEPTTGLDVTVQRHVLGVLQRVHREANAAILFISHDIAVISQICQRVLVMYGGMLVEDLSTADLIGGGARHPYTRQLLAAIPDMAVDVDQPLATIPGSPPEPESAPRGCPFAPRCAFADEQCAEETPQLVRGVDGHGYACWHPIAAAELVSTRSKTGSGGQR